MIEVDPSLMVLDDLRRKTTVRAEGGQNGGPAKRKGRNGRDTIVKVPAGTVVWLAGGDEGQLADLTVLGMKAIVAKGGEGGRGNARFATSTRRTPRFAERGLPGGTVRLRLELRLLADVGLVGLPNAGKSSLLRAVSAATPKVGGYPFTTVEPNLGVVERDHETLVFADIPGLIAGAHEGVGLGTAFLRHIGRTRVLVHVVDSTAAEPASDIDVVRRELSAFGQGLDAKPWLVALNKADLPEAAERAAAVAPSLSVESHVISATTGEGVEKLVAAVWKLVAKARAAEPVPEPPLVQPRSRRAIEVTKVGGGYRLAGDRPERAAAQLGEEGGEARAELVRRLQRMGAVAALRRAGVADGDRVRIGTLDLEWPL